MTDSLDGKLGSNSSDSSRPSGGSAGSSFQTSEANDESSKNQKSRKRTHGSQELQSLLEEANRYNTQYAYELPRGFLRDRSAKSENGEAEMLGKKPDAKLKGKIHKKSLNDADGEGVKTPLRNDKLPKRRPKSNSRKESRSNDDNNKHNVKARTEKNEHMDHSRIRGQIKQDGSESSFVNWNVRCQGQHNMLDMDYLKSTAAFHGNPIPSTVLTCKRRDKTPETVTVGLKSALFPNYEEQYDISFTRDLQIYNPMSEIGKIIEYMAAIFLPQPYADELKRTIVPQLNQAFDHRNTSEFASLVRKYNLAVEKIPRAETLDHLANVKTIPLSYIHDFLHIVYTRSIFPECKRLKQYEAFSNYVYGELLPTFLSEAFERCNLKPGQIFMDLGSGVGNCVIQAALECGCSLSFGCEIMSNASDLTEYQHRELLERCKLFGLKLAPVEFSLRQSFIGNKRVDELMPLCDVLLVNNFLFDSKMNTEVEKLIQSAKVGCKIITLKNLRSSGYTINFFNLESILNRLHVERFELKNDSVSWTHTGGEYYISTVMETMDESLFDPTLRQRSTRRPTRYTR
ncbi:related to Histone-lysine N-methyltransferase, H3 lysine-79 specific [Zygosaccharomyces bailii]|nr:related to Histone-lysine N-methyltransferase, H3 lysine-79 specific [Zygosaccharomyces bailii]